jgi:hypothetical protein
MRAIVTLGLVACTTTPTAAAGSAAMATTASAVAPSAAPPRNPVREALASRFGQDPEAASVALGSFDATGTSFDVLPAQRFDGGYRGTIDLAPALPIGADGKHLAWVTGALKDFDGFFAAIARSGSPHYRWRDLTVRFFRSVGNTTPNAFAAGWTISYNVRGSIDTSADAARETLFHEIFHLNDADHGDWSPSHLAGIQGAIEKRCGARTACLAPYAPTSTVVRRGTYYAFQPGNDAHEYAAEVALRWYREERAILRGDAPVRPSFKCGPEENRRAWVSVETEFFAGVDLVPPC